MARTPQQDAVDDHFDVDNPLGLDPFEGQAVTELGISIPSAGSGFSEPLEVDPTLIDLLKYVKAGDTIYAVFQLAKVKVHHDPAKNHDGWKRVDVFKVEGVAILDSDMAVEAIQAQRERVQMIKESKLGIDHGDEV